MIWLWRLLDYRRRLIRALMRRIRRDQAEVKRLQATEKGEREG